MADERFPNDPYRPNLADDEYARAARRDAELQADPELGEGPASSGKVAMFAVAIALVLGAVFYGLNNTSTNNQASNAPASQTAQTQPTNPSSPDSLTSSAPPSLPSTPQVSRSSRAPLASPPWAVAISGCAALGWPRPQRAGASSAIRPAYPPPGPGSSSPPPTAGSP